MTECNDDIRPECARELADIHAEMWGQNATMKSLNDERYNRFRDRI